MRLFAPLERQIVGGREPINIWFLWSQNIIGGALLHHAMWLLIEKRVCQYAGL
jgi:hypothetical protein